MLAENAKLSNQNAALEARAFEAERTVQDMLASTSWRITSPLRAIKKYYCQLTDVEQDGATNVTLLTDPGPPSATPR
jgi:hypothetical protein